WTPATIGEFGITAVAVDDDSSATTSKSVSIEVLEAPSCRGTAFNGDFDYEFSDDDNNPTITFIPSLAGMGSPTCILYYGTDANSLPGYNVTPNVPFQINASEGEKIYFYYTYSHPAGGERNTSANKNSYQIGSCKSENSTSSEEFETDLPVKFYPNPVTDILHLELPLGKNNISVFDISGRLIELFIASDSYLNYDMSNFSSGLYLFQVVNDGRIKRFKVVK
ncbi:MAG: T9SS type A sorting domain-containing protein, partial [Bacteroidetes bacterium]|nr:T9SS type A sorting domain-containing protein [Bacteroidota bacterium]